MKIDVEGIAVAACRSGKPQGRDVQNRFRIICGIGGESSVTVPGSVAKRQGEAFGAQVGSRGFVLAETGEPGNQGNSRLDTGNAEKPDG